MARTPSPFGHNRLAGVSPIDEITQLGTSVAERDELFDDLTDFP